MNEQGFPPKIILDVQIPRMQFKALEFLQDAQAAIYKEVEAKIVAEFTPEHMQALIEHRVRQQLENELDAAARRVTTHITSQIEHSYQHSVRQVAMGYLSSLLRRMENDDKPESVIQRR